MELKKIWWKAMLAAILLPVFLVFGVTVGIYYNQNTILQHIVEKVNNTFHGKIKIDGIHVAPFANFPYISVDLENVKFYESTDTTCHPLYSFIDVYVGFDIWDIIHKNYIIKSIKLEKGHIDIIHLEDGSYNILKAKETNTSDTTTNALQLDIKKIKLSDVDIAYIDRIANRETDVYIDKLSSKVRIQDSHFYIDLVGDMRLDVLENDKPTFFVKKEVHIDFELDYDKIANKMTLLPSVLLLNKVQFRAEGQIDVANDMDLSIKLRGDKPDFSILAAFMPEDIGNALISYQNAGKIFFDGNIQGKSINGHIPLVKVEFGCEEGYFLNTSAKKKLDQLSFKGKFTNGDLRTLESSQLEIRNFNARPEQGLFVGHLFIKNFKDPFIKMDVHADLDLDFLGKFFRLKDFDGIKGHVLLDMNFDELIDLNFGASSLAQLKKGIDSELNIRGLQFNMPEYGYEITDANVHAIMKEGVITMDSFAMNINKNDIWLSGSLSDFPAVFHKYDKPVKVTMEARSKTLDLKELLAFNPEMASKIDEKIEDLSMKLSFDTKAKDLFDFKYLPKGEFYIDNFYARLKHYPHVLHDFHADVIITENDFQLIDFSGVIDDSDFHFSGTLNNYTKWFQDHPKGDSNLEFDLTSKLLKINNIMTYKGNNYVPESYRNEVFQNSKLHGRVAMHYDDGFKSVDLYLDELTAKMNIHPLKLEKFNGRAHYENDHLLLENFAGKMGKSDFNINMSYFLGNDISKQEKDNYLNINSSALDLDALMDYKGPEEKIDHNKAYNIFAQPFPNISVKARIGKLNYHKYWLQDFNTDLRIKENHYVYVDTLSMKVADGNMQMSGYFNGSDPNNIYYHSTINAQQLDIDKLLFKFDNFGQDQLINDKLHGKISGTIKSTFKMHPDLTPIIEASKANMDLVVLDGRIENFTPLQTMSKYFKDKNLNKIRFDTLVNEFELDNGTLNIPNMVINSSLGHIQLSGRQKIDLSMEYFLRVPLKIATKSAWRHVFGSKNTQEVDPEQMDEIENYDPTKKVRYINLKLEGTPEDFKVKMGKDKKKK
jgi:hypothetical protein